MSITTTITIKRGASQTNPNGGVIVATCAGVQIDEKSPMLASEYDRAHPTDVFDGYITFLSPGTPTRRGDAWLDMLNLDPLTKLPTFYQVVGRPETFPDGHVEAVLHIYEGAA